MSNFDNKYNQIEIELNSLRSLSLTVNYKLAADRKIFFDCITNIKQLYKEVECLITQYRFVPVPPPTMRMYISRPIHPQQMEAWVTKLYNNVVLFLVDVAGKTNEEHKEFIKTQNTLLDSIVKVLNGNAYFVGCSHCNINH